jgi:hypothetical protein
MTVILVSSVVFERNNKPNPAFEPTPSARLNLTLG